MWIMELATKTMTAARKIGSDNAARGTMLVSFELQSIDR
jgi:hypothetical protein